MAKSEGTKKSGGRIKPLSDRVLVRTAEEKAEKKTASGIIIPGSVDQDRGAKRGTVVAVGDGRYEDGKLIPVKVKVGETVLFQWGDEVKVDGETFHILSESNILAVIK